ncbi:hypothetical protein B0H14DRAFT_3124443 [Mycena olivaceomarginata]|nr:hypothetical protein B0H14DRAFT_3124443 [Mycena olivaceomarginata]
MLSTGTPLCAANNPPAENNYLNWRPTTQNKVMRSKSSPPDRFSQRTDIECNEVNAMQGMKAKKDSLTSTINSEKTQKRHPSLLINNLDGVLIHSAGIQLDGRVTAKIMDRAITKVRGPERGPGSDWREPPRAYYSLLCLLSATSQDRQSRRQVDCIWQALSGWVVPGQAGAFVVGSINFNAFEGYGGALVVERGKNMFENKI